MRYVIPNSKRASIDSYGRCFAGISLGNENFSTAKLLALSHWIDARFSKCVILIPDSVYRLSLQISHGMSEPEAVKAAARMADNFIEQSCQIFKENGDCCFTILRSRDVVTTPEYQENLNKITNLYANDDAFKQAVLRFTESFLSRKFQQPLDSVKRDRLVDLSSQFLIEELSIAACLVEQGYPVSVYPGTIEIFHEIAAGLYEGLPQPLQSLVNVGIYYKKRRIVEEIAA